MLEVRMEKKFAVDRAVRSADEKKIMKAALEA
jgi:hypothetical protein